MGVPPGTTAARNGGGHAEPGTLKNVQSMGAPTAHTVVEERDFADGSDGHELPGALVEDELVVAVIPQGRDEFVCPSCFTVRHRSQLVSDPAGMGHCRDCAS